MNSPQDKHEELQRWELELQAREQELQLREQQVNGQVPFYQTTKEPPTDKLKGWQRKLLNVGKFVGVVVAVTAAMQIAAWLAYAIIVGAIAWVAYKIFLESDRPPK